MKTFLVTGASGFLGYNLCLYLTKKGHKVVGVDIQDFDYPALKNLDFHKGDIRDRSLMQKISKGIDVTVHCAAALPLWNRKDIFTTNVDGTKITLKTSFQGGAEMVIFISSTSVYGIPKTHPVDETYPVVGVGPYGESKIEAEHVCEDFRRKGYFVPVLRPKSFAGPWRLGVFQILCQWIREGRNIPIIGSGKNRYQLLHVDDLCDAIYFVSHSPKGKVNETFNIGATEFTTMKDDLQALLDYAGFGKKVKAIPTWLVIPVLKLFEKTGLSPLYEWIYETAYEDHYVSVDKIKKALGWKPKKSTAQVWIDTYKWYLDNYKEYEGKTGVTHRVAWDPGILNFFKHFF